MHDKNGTPLKEGDRVRFTGRIASLTGGESQCNVTVESTHEVEGEGKATISHVNSRFFEKVEDEEGEQQAEQQAEQRPDADKPRDNVRTDEELAAEREQKEAKK